MDTALAQLHDRFSALEQENALLRARLQSCEQGSLQFSVGNASEHRLLEATTQAANALLTISDFDQAVNTALQILGESLDTDRVAVIENIQQERTQQALLQAEQARSQELERHNTELQQTLDRLTTSEQRYRQIMDIVGEGILRVEYKEPISLRLSHEEQLHQIYQHFRIAEHNLALAEMYGYDQPNALVGTSLTDLHVMDDPATIANMKQFVQDGWCNRNMETIEADRFGRKHYFLNNTVTLFQDGCATSAWVTQIDITELRETQQALLEAERVRAAELAKVNDELRQRDRLLSVVAQITQDLLEAEAVETAIPAALQAVGEAASMSRVLLFLERLDPETQRLKHYVVHEWVSKGVFDHAAVDLTVLDNEDFQSLIQPLHRGESAWSVIDDFPHETRSLFKALAIQSSGAVPIFIEGQYIGAITFDDCIVPRQWSLQEINVLTAAAESVGAALHRKQLVDRLIAERLQAEQARSQGLERANNALQSTVAALADRRDLEGFIGEVLHTIARELESPLVEYWTVLGSDTVEVDTWLYDNQLCSLKQHDDHPSRGGIRLLPDYTDCEDFTCRRQVLVFDEPMPAYSLALGRVICPIEWYAERGVSRHFNFPLQAGEATVGAISVWMPSDRQITEECLRLGQALSHQTALAIQLTQLAEEAKQAAIAREQEKAAQERAAELAKANEALARTSSRLAEQPSLSAFLSHLMLEAMAQVGADGGHLTLYDKQRDMISTAVLIEDGKMVQAPSFPPEMPVAEVGFIQLIRETRKLRYFDLESHFEQDAHLLWSEVGEYHKRHKHLAGIAIPLYAGDEFLGHFGLAFTYQKLISEQGAELLQALAHQASLAIQLTQLAEEAKQAAIFEERNRMASEIHDTLAQAFTGISIQLEVVNPLIEQNPQAAQQILSYIRQLADNGLSEARRSVWALYPPAAEYADLAQLLYDSVEQMTRNTATTIEVNLQGNPCPLPPFIGMNLLRIGQEALTNALKHAQAQTIAIELVYEIDRILLTIRDNGRGFTTPTTIDPLNGGFGLVGMYERCDRINAQLSLTSQPGQGTQILVEAPLT